MQIPLSFIFIQVENAHTDLETTLTQDREPDIRKMGIKPCTLTVRPGQGAMGYIGFPFSLFFQPSPDSIK